MGGLDSVAIRNIFPDVVRHEQSPELGAIDAPSFDHLPCPLLPGPTTCSLVQGGVVVPGTQHSGVVSVLAE